MMIGYHASHEQFSPRELSKLAQQAEMTGFQGVLSSDHFYPWSDAQGQSGFAWSWLGAAMQSTSLPFGIVCAPGQRYHPAIIAQAAATLEDMFPGRFWIALGSGQLLNEAITGDRWPAKTLRNARLQECAGIIRRMWAGETVTHYGHVTVEQAKLYTRPHRPPPIIGAAITAETAEWIGGWADGLITISHPVEEMTEVLDAFRRGGGEGKPLFLKVQVSYHRDEKMARQGAYEQWRTNIFESTMLTDLRCPEQFDAAAAYVKPEDIDDHVRISSDLAEHVGWLREYLDMGFDHIFVHNVNRDQRQFIEDFGREVLPALSGARKPESAMA